jgi:hypothetical protein
MATENPTALPSIQNNDALPTLFVDGATIHSRKDGMFYIRLTALHPDAMHEQVRIMVNDTTLRKIIDVFCGIAKYYPEQPKEVK